jgi:hypothetical protein
MPMSGDMQGIIFPEVMPPITIEFIDIYRDGGSIPIVILDSKGTEIRLRVDGVLGSKTRDRLYINALAPDRQREQLVPRGAEFEEAILKALQEYLDRKFTPEEQEELKNAYGRRKLSERQRVAALCINAIERIRNPRGERE